MALRNIALAALLVLPACSTFNNATSKIGISAVQNPCANATSIADRGFCTQESYETVLRTCDDLTALEDADIRIINACADGARLTTPLVATLTTATLTYVDAKALYDDTLEQNGDGNLTLTLLASVQEAGEIARAAYADAKPRVDQFLIAIEGVK